MPKVNKNLTWSPLNLENAKGDLAKAVGAFDKAKETLTKSRAALESVLKAEMVAKGLVPEGKVPIFSYRFGVAVAFDDAENQSKAGGAAIAL